MFQLILQNFLEWTGLATGLGIDQLMTYFGWNIHAKTHNVTWVTCAVKIYSVNRNRIRSQSSFIHVVKNGTMGFNKIYIKRINHCVGVLEPAKTGLLDKSYSWNTPKFFKINIWYCCLTFDIAVCLIYIDIYIYIFDV